MHSHGYLSHDLYQENRYDDKSNNEIKEVADQLSKGNDLSTNSKYDQTTHYPTSTYVDCCDDVDINETTLRLNDRLLEKHNQTVLSDINPVDEVRSDNADDGSVNSYATDQSSATGMLGKPYNRVNKISHDEANAEPRGIIEDRGTEQRVVNLSPEESSRPNNIAGYIPPEPLTLFRDHTLYQVPVFSGSRSPDLNSMKYSDISLRDKALVKPLIKGEPSLDPNLKSNESKKLKNSELTRAIYALLPIVCILAVVLLWMSYQVMYRVIDGNSFAGQIEIELFKHVPLASFDLAAKHNIFHYATLEEIERFDNIVMSAQLNHYLITNLRAVRNPYPLVDTLPHEELMEMADSTLKEHCQNYRYCRFNPCPLKKDVINNSFLQEAPLGDNSDGKCYPNDKSNQQEYRLALNGADYQILKAMSQLLKDQSFLKYGHKPSETDERCPNNNNDHLPFRIPDADYPECSTTDNGCSIVPLEDYENVTYYGTIQLGPAGESQEFSVVFDTGSSNLWIPADSCDSSACLSHRRFRKTRTTRTSSLVLDMSYGSGSASGVVVNDELVVGGYRVPDVTFGTMTNVDALGDSYALGSFDGVFGLGWPSLAVDQITPPFNIMLSRGILSKPLFSFSMIPENKRSGRGGYLVLGGYREDDIAPGSHIEWIPLERETFWQAKIEKLNIRGDFGSTTLDTTTRSFIVDSGTSLLTAPSPDVKALVNIMGAFSLPEQPGVLLMKRDQLLSRRFDLEFHVLNQEGDTVSVMVKQEDWIQCPLVYPAPCILSLEALDVPAPNGPLWIFGDIFLARYLAIFDFGGRRIGLAPSKYGLVNHLHNVHSLTKEGLSVGWD